MKNPWSQLSSATVLTVLGIVVLSAGCLSAPPAPVSDAQIETLLSRLRGAGHESGAWQANGRGRMLATQGTVRLLADGEGRFRMQLDGAIPYAEVHDGEITSKLYPWGRVLATEGGEEEMSLLPMWVVTGYWLAPEAPVLISAGAAGRQGDLIALEVRHRDGNLPFEVLVDAEKSVPVSVKPAVGVPTLEIEIDDHRMFNGRPIPGTVRFLKNGRATVELELEPPQGILPGEDTWSRPEATARATYDHEVPALLEALDDGRGYLFVRPVINGRQMGWFLFDTGAPATILGNAAVKRLGLSGLGETESSGVGGFQGIGIHALESIQIGPVRIGPTLTASMDVLRLGWRDLPIEGILGCDVIGSAVVEYDIRSTSIVFLDPATYELPTSVSWRRIQLYEGKPIARLQFEGHEGDFLVDTGAGGTFSISKLLVDRFDLLAGRKTEAVGTRGVGGSVGMRRGTVRWLEFGGRRYENVSTRFAVAEQGSYAEPFPDGIVGIRLIDDYRVVFDLANRRMAFSGREG